MIGSHILKIIILKTGQKKHDIALSYNPQSTGLIEITTGILKRQIKLLTGKIILPEWTTARSQALIHLNDQPLGPVAPFARPEIPAR